MNKKQRQYLFGRLSNNLDIVYSCFSGLLGYDLIGNILNYQNMENPEPLIIAEGILMYIVVLDHLGLVHYIGFYHQL